MTEKEKIYTFLESNCIPYTLYEHPATPTVEMAKVYWAKCAPGVQHCKNIFMRNHKGDKHYLVIMDCDRTLDTKAFARKIGSSRLSFASDHRLMTYLGVTPGSVGVFGLLNDKGLAVKLYIDKSLDNSRDISFHPNDCTASLVISHDDFLRVIKLSGHEPEFIDLDS